MVSRRALLLIASVPGHSLPFNFNWELKHYKFYINDDTGLTLTYFATGSNLIACGFKGNTVRKLFYGKNSQ